MGSKKSKLLLSKLYLNNKQMDEYFENLKQNYNELHTSDTMVELAFGYINVFNDYSKGFFFFK
jgi:hypothetical protein